MKLALHSFFLLLAGSTDDELRKQVQYLKEENRILRGKLPRRIVVTAEERHRLVKLGLAVGKALKDLISIVSPRTFLRWVNGEAVAKPPKKAAKPGRPRTPEEIRDLVLKLARETGGGYTRILGELKKLGVRKICRSTVIKILKENGLQPGPERGEGTWDEFLKRHAATLWACDFFSQKVWTLGGMVDVFVLFFLPVGSRRVFVSGVTAHPDRAWVLQQARNVSMYFGDEPVKPTHLLRDNDGKFRKEFDALLEADGMTVKKIVPRSPNLNAYAERFVQSIKQECLAHFLVLGESHLRHLVTEYVAYYHRERPHQAKDNLPLTATGPPTVTPLTVAEVVCEERLAGLLKHYRRAG